MKDEDGWDLEGIAEDYERNPEAWTWFLACLMQLAEQWHLVLPDGDVIVGVELTV